MQILAYITGNQERYLGGDPLALFIPDSQERDAFLQSFAKAMRADVIQLNNGDHLVVIASSI